MPDIDCGQRLKLQEGAPAKKKEKLTLVWKLNVQAIYNDDKYLTGQT